MGYLDGLRPRIFGHRGASGECPENTLPAFERAVAQGATVLELDVHMTSDREVVVLHDATVERTTDGAGEVASMTLGALQSLDAGARFVNAQGERPYAGCGVSVPTLDAVLGRFEHMAVNIEVKSDAEGIEHEVMRVIDRHRARPRVLLAAEHLALMERLRAVASDVLTGFSMEEGIEFLVRHDDPTYVPQGAALQVPRELNDGPLVTEAFVAAAHQKGVEVHVWVLNTDEELRAMLSLGVDGVMTDFPSRAAQMVRGG